VNADTTPCGTTTRDIACENAGTADIDVRIRELGPGRFDVLDAVLAALSPTSRYRRFHTSAPRPTPQVLALLAAVDGRSHIAVAAFTGSGRPVGIARIIAVPGGRSELAVEVADDWQGRGIGARLVRAVVERGRAAGHRVVHADVLAENVAAQALFLSVFPAAVAVSGGHEVGFAAELAAPRDPVLVAA
jgi:GNAT superfamily N-acetyltransferase